MARTSAGLTPAWAVVKRKVETRAIPPAKLLRDIFVAMGCPFALPISGSTFDWGKVAPLIYINAGCL